MKKNILILGAGRVGSECTRLLLQRGHDVTVIEKNKERVENIKSTTTATIIQGDVSDTDILNQADLSNVDAVLAVTGDVQANLATCLILEEMDVDPYTVLRVASEDQKENYKQFVDNVVFPELSAAESTVSDVDRGFNVMGRFGDGFNVYEVIVDEDAPVANKQIKNISFPDNTLVIADNSNICSGETKLEPNNTYLLVCEPKSSEDIKIMFNG